MYTYQGKCLKHSFWSSEGGQVWVGLNGDWFGKKLKDWFILVPPRKKPRVLPVISTSGLRVATRIIRTWPKECRWISSCIDDQHNIMLHNRLITKRKPWVDRVNEWHHDHSQAAKNSMPARHHQGPFKTTKHIVHVFFGMLDWVWSHLFSLRGIIVLTYCRGFQVSPQ